MGVSCEPPSTEEELDSGGGGGGGTDPERQLGAGLHSPEVLDGVWTLLFFRRRVSIQLELCREAKVARASEDRRMFFPEVMSSPKPSWWAKA